MSEKIKSLLPFSDLPEGTVTFLFTDIEGSTFLLKQLGSDQYGQVLADQRSIMREAFDKWGGQEVDTQGDAFFVSFARATQAVHAAVEIQRALAVHQWPDAVEVRVRMGLHTGEPLKAEEGYVGMDVHRAARIAHVGHGGQVLLSETTAPLVKSELPEGVDLLDLSRHRLKDIRDPEHIHQLVIDGLPSEFRPLKSLEMPPSAIAFEVGEVKLPEFLEEGVEPVPPPVFVGRERELACLQGYLEQAVAGQGGLVFITGGPGRGKTALMQAFARWSMKTHPDLLVVSGKCNAYTGVGDPYLPFREALGDLTGDVKTKWAAGAISSDHATRLWKALPFTAQALVEHGPDLVEVFISGKGVLSRAKRAVPDRRGLLQSLRSLAERERATPGELEQIAIFEQYLDVLCELTSKYPLLILLDDLQWADSASLNLLFHLGRELSERRILLIGAYRPEEVALGRRGERHPLEEILAELKRLYGDVWIDLSAETIDEGRTFIAEFIDSEPNRFSEDFRDALFAHTEGHPLFTIELLREMQARGDLVRDEGGNWIEGESLNWNRLPARVEGVIEARIGRLEDELREILTTASVEGEDFTAQVVAQVQELSENKLLGRLSAELEKRHRLVHARGEDRVGDHILSQYRFSHTLFQQFLYNGVTPGERRLLHKEIALILEELYAGDKETIQLQLAHHYSAANQGEKAVPYLLLIGDQARNAYAHKEAIGYYQRALFFQEQLGDYEGAARTQMKLGQTYHSAFEYRRANEAYEASFSLWVQESDKSSQVSHPLSSRPLMLNLNRDPFPLDPCLSISNDSGIVFGHLFSGLLEHTPEMDVVPDLTHRWEILEGGRKYVFHLREDAHWSDGTMVTANDFVYAWRRLLNPATQSGAASLLYDIRGARAYHLGETTQKVSLGIQATSPLTLEVELEAPTGYFLQLMAHTAVYPVPAHVVEKFGDAWTDVGNIIGNGPYLLESKDGDKSITFVRNPKYHGHFSGNVKSVEISSIPARDWDVRASMYQDNELDVMDITFFPPAEMNRLRRLHSSEYLSAPSQTIYYMVFNTSRAPFDDLRVRRAFVMALDGKSRGVASSSGALLPAMGGLIPPGIPGHSPDIGLPYDPGGAQKLMVQAGYPEGREFPILEVLIMPGAETQLENMITQWQKVLCVEQTWDYARLLDFEERMKEKPSHMVFQAWVADYPDPDNFLRVGFNKALSGWQGDAFDELVEHARRSQDQRERIRLYQQADKMLINEAVILPLSYGMQHWLVKPWVKNYPLSPSEGWFLKEVIIEPH